MQDYEELQSEIKRDTPTKLFKMMFALILVENVMIT